MPLFSNDTRLLLAAVGNDAARNMESQYFALTSM